MSYLAHGSGDWHDIWLSATPFVVSAIMFLVLRSRAGVAIAVPVDQ